ncbi:kinesin-like protein Klp98A isoform X2 [Condylostylus longicornis]|uniref:kinesin-like protein Klp98A isoform X2 n=1 Tax=Condylostylus longicornis TaxID=2530218 RepID=UPI00244DF411|nr:kinesin-like protein Klp98A isoform X2 [Condylostylus longicornis]
MSSLKVAVRVRPFNQREIDMEAMEIVEMDNKKTRLYKPKLQSIRDSGRENFHDFTFDYSYWSFNEKDSHFTPQEQVYKDLGTDVVDCAFQGYNACVFAYGQTGSGKTFTMMGTENNPGLIPRICQELFARMRIGQESGTGYKTHASYLEIYNERVKDLLGPATTGHGLRVREHRDLGPYVENLSQHIVSDFEEIQGCLTRGNYQRTTASTNMNDTSSRSHAIFTITFVQAVFMNDMPSETVSKIHLVDLAGSERANATGATGQRLKEGAHINKSLVTLGSVISALAEQTNRAEQNKRVLYIPYRDSVLTWLLKDSLGGNSKTIMIAAISPADCNYSETLSTLRYANRAKNIINKPTINEDANVKLIRELREEINKLKLILSNGMLSKEPGSKMLEDLLKKEAQEKVLTEEWTEKWKEAQLILQEQKSLGLRKAGVGVILDSEMPHLIGIHNDMTTGVTLYSLKEGETLIGTEESEEPQDICLTGIDIRPQHCSIVLKEGQAILNPRPLAQCWLNANIIDEPTSISQGDIILLGRTNIFRFNNPAEAAKLRKDLNRSQMEISRLSLITASRENLLSNSVYGEDDLLLSGSTTSPFKRDKQYYPSPLTSHDDPELQDENRKILETIENALKQLNIERVQMHEQYKSKVRKLTNELDRLKKEENDIMKIYNCHEQELLARKDMLLWEKNNEKTQIGIKITDNTPLSDDLLTQASESLYPSAAQFIRDTIKRNNEEIKKLDEQIKEKEQILNVSTERIAKLDEDILKLEEQLRELKENVPEKNNVDHVKLKKQSMKLNLQSSLDSPTLQGCAGEPGTITQTLDTSETYHTATSNCSQISSEPPTTTATCSPSTDNTFSNDTNAIHTTTTISTNGSPPMITNPLMSDSGVCLESLRPNGPNMLNMSNGGGPSGCSNGLTLDSSGVNIKTSTPNGSCNNVIVRNSDEDTTSCSSCEHARQNDMSRPYCIMHRLRRKIAMQKALIMKNLEMEVNKCELDDQIAQLQELQRRYFTMEKELQLSGEHSECCSPDSESEFNADNTECSSSIMMSSNVLTPYGQNTFLTTSTTRSCPSIDGGDPDHFISIPSFVIRGAGKQTHYEYEVRIILPDGKLNILRRFSRFRELHLAMKNTYGAKVSMLTFPRRELFSSNSESVAKQRRRHLELYLRRLITVCSKIPQSPIYEGEGGHGVTKASLALFSPFFKKGLFENGKHGTG